MTTIFTHPPELAYAEAFDIKVGPSKWCAFDVLMPDARKGKAQLFAMTLWANRLVRDATSSRLWYTVPRESLTASNNRTHLCRAIRLAVKYGLPMKGMLKDNTGDQHCSPKHLFNIVDVFEDEGDDTIYLSVVPLFSGDLGCVPSVRAIEKPSWQPDGLKELQVTFEAQVAAAMKDPDREARLRVASKIPATTTVLTTVFVRNPDVVAQVLADAAGTCGRCAKTAPFFRRNGTPYLEVHHKVRLADGGEDTVANAVALCPNCHRELHYA